MTTMRMLFGRILVLVAILSLFTPVVYAQLYHYESRDLRVITIGRLSDFLVPHSERCFKNALEFYRQLYGYEPWDKITFFIEDFTDYGNGSASIYPRNLITMDIAPRNYIFETAPGNERVNGLMNHEVVHIVTLDQSAPSDNFFRSIFFGKVMPQAENPVSVLYSYLTNPRRACPRWYAEGITTFMETWNAGGLGRALGGYDEMVFRTRVAEGRELFNVNTVEAEGTAIDFQAGAVSYLYGERFFTYLAYQYSPEKVIEWTKRTGGSKAHFASQFEHVFGLPLDDALNRWIDFERGWDKVNIDSIRQTPVTADRPLFPHALGSISRAFYEPGMHRLYAAVRFPGQVASLVAVNTEEGTFENLTDVKGPALYYTSSVAYHPGLQKLFFTSDHTGWRDLNSYDIKTGKKEELLTDARIGDLVINRSDSSLWGVRHDLGLSTIVRIPYPYTEWNQVYTLPYGKDAFDLDISHDGKHIVAGMTDILGRQKLVLFAMDSLMAGVKTYAELFDFDYNPPANFVFTNDDKLLYGSSYYTGVSNIFRYTFDTKSMDIVTNCETGYFRPIPYSDDSLIVYRYTTDGFIPVVIPIIPPERVGAIHFLGQGVVEKHPIVTQWKVKSPSPTLVQLDSVQTEGDYSPFANIRLVSMYPVAEGYKDFVSYGLRLTFADPVMLNSSDVTFGFSPNRLLPVSERFHAALNYRYWEWTFGAAYNASQFYDLFGPTKTSRKGYSLSLKYKRYLIYDDPRTLDLTVASTGYWGLERLPEYQNITAPVDNFATLSGSLTYQFNNKSIGAVDDEKGYKAELVSRNSYVLSSFIPRLQTNLDYGIALPINHSSVWLRSSWGLSFGERTDPFANFYFGGFGNNWVDYQEPKRYREDYSFPGIELNAAGGKTYGKVLLEWDLPPLRFRSLGWQDLYCNWARLALFSSGLAVNPDNSAFRKNLVNVGSQADFRLAFLSALENTISVGYAIGVVENQRPTREFMVSLKILK